MDVGREKKSHPLPFHLSITHSSARINRVLGGLLIRSPWPTVLQSFLLGC